MIALVPVSRFTARYEVGAGRPYSKLEELTLRMAAEAPRGMTLAELRDTFRVPDRLLIESVVTLVRAGWLAIGGADGLVATEDGKEAIAGGRRLQGTTSRGATSSLIVERVCGLIKPENHYDRPNIRSRWEIKTALREAHLHAVELPARYTKNNLNEGQVRQLLVPKPDEWIRWIGPIKMMSKDFHFVPVHVDLGSGTVSGLPSDWERLLRGPVLEAARDQAENGGEAGLAEDAAPSLFELRHNRFPRRPAEDEGTAFRVRIHDDDLVLSAEEGVREIKRLLESASSMAIFAVPRIDNAALTAIEPTLVEALRRGVTVDVLWGGAEAAADQKQGALAVLKRISAMTARGPQRLLRFNQLAAPVRGRVAIADVHGQMSAVVGGPGLDAQTWQAAGGDPDLRAPGLRLRDPGVIATLAHAVAGWWEEAPGEELSTSRDRWRRVAADCEQEVAIRRVDVQGQADAGSAEGSGPSGATTSVVRVLLDAQFATASASEDGEPLGPAFETVEGTSLLVSDELVLLGSHPLRPEQKPGFEGHISVEIRGGISEVLRSRVTASAS